MRVGERLWHVPNSCTGSTPGNHLPKQNSGCLPGTKSSDNNRSLANPVDLWTQSLCQCCSKQPQVLPRCICCLYEATTAPDQPSQVRQLLQPCSSRPLGLCITYSHPTGDAKLSVGTQPRGHRDPGFNCDVPAAAELASARQAFPADGIRHASTAKGQRPCTLLWHPCCSQKVPARHSADGIRRASTADTLSSNVASSMQPESAPARHCADGISPSDTMHLGLRLHCR